MRDSQITRTDKFLRHVVLWSITVNLALAVVCATLYLQFSRVDDTAPTPSLRQYRWMEQTCGPAGIRRVEQESWLTTPVVFEVYCTSTVSRLVPTNRELSYDQSNQQTLFGINWFKSDKSQ